jgi:hypothetical protein
MGHGSLGPQGQVRIPTPSCPRPGDEMDNLSRVGLGANGVERKAKT